MLLVELKDRFNNIAIWKKGNQRAPHKPLLLLYALSQVDIKKDRYIPYNAVREKLGYLLKQFGPDRKSYHPEQPFVCLKNDGIWELNQSIQNNEFSNRLLLAQHISGGFTQEVYQQLVGNPELIHELAQMILNQHFPETFHEDILNALELDFHVDKKEIKERETVLLEIKYLKHMNIVVRFVDSMSDYQSN
nr:hypothetical protein [Fictibacillus sp. 5RED26]